MQDKNEINIRVTNNPLIRLTMSSGIERSFENDPTAEELESKMCGEEIHPYMCLYRPILDPSVSFSDAEEDPTKWSTELQDQDAPKLIRTSVLQKHPVQYATRIYDVLSMGTRSTPAGRNSSADASPPLQDSEKAAAKKDKESDRSEKKEKMYRKENASSISSIVSEGSGRSNRRSFSCLEDNGSGNKSAEKKNDGVAEQSDEIGPCFRDQPGPSFFSRTYYSDGNEKKKKKDRKRKRGPNIISTTDDKVNGKVDESTKYSDGKNSTDSDSDSDSDSENTFDVDSKKMEGEEEEKEVKVESKGPVRRTPQQIYPNGKYPDADFEAIAKEKPNEDYSKDVLTDNGPYRDYFWNLRFRELLEYHKKFNTLHVPDNLEYKSLHAFCQLQRAAFNHKHMHPDRFRRLNSIGFVWNPREGRATWDEHFEKLVAFHKEHGHANVLKRYKPNPVFGLWTHHQRKAYNCERLHPERVEKLESLGFIWDITMRTWRKRYEELKKFKEKHGHFRVPADNDNQHLVRFLKLRQREWARGRLPDEHEGMLSLIGLDFSIEEKETKSTAIL